MVHLVVAGSLPSINVITLEPLRPFVTLPTDESANLMKLIEGRYVDARVGTARLALSVRSVWLRDSWQVPTPGLLRETSQEQFVPGRGGAWWVQGLGRRGEEGVSREESLLVALAGRLSLSLRAARRFLYALSLVPRAAVPHRTVNGQL